MQGLIATTDINTEMHLINSDLMNGFSFLVD
jgi:hypothetical protein